MKKILVSLAIVGLTAGGVIGRFQSTAALSSTFQPFSPLQQVLFLRPTPVPVTVPVALSIPSINVAASVEMVGTDVNGNMAVPLKPEDVGWYQYGAKPGETGRAVIDGHLDTAAAPAVFMNLSKVRPGDEIIVTDQQGINRTFRVYRVAAFNDQTFPLTSIFGASDQAELNLITCTGPFSRSQQNYLERLVVFSQLEE